MKLTPIRVRGKRGQPKPVKKSKIQGKDDTEVYGQPEKKKRVKKYHGDDDDTRVKRARLHQLPHEILERIFIASQNLCLPLVSRELYHMLSSDSIKYRLVGAAFGPTWDAYYGCDNFEVVSYDGWQSDAERIEGDPTFQSSVLACSWAKLPMLLTSFDVWIRQQSKGRAYFHIPELKQERLRMVPQPGSLYERAYIDETAADDDGDNDDPANSSSSTTMTMREKLAFDLVNFETLVSYSSSAPNVPAGQIYIRDNPYRLRAMLGMHLEVHPGARVPGDLLAGPFESDDGDVGVGVEKMERLFWLVRGGACLQEDQTWEVTREGFKQILRLIKADVIKSEGGDDDHEQKEEGSDKEDDNTSTTISTTTTTNNNDTSMNERLELAARILALFNLLGVFDTPLHWPRYISQTSLAQVSALIPRATAPGSRQEALLGELAALLRQNLGQYGASNAVGPAGGRWRRRPRMLQQDRLAVQGRNTHLVVFASVWRQRARLFLGEPGGGRLGGQQGHGQQPSSPLVAAGAGGGGVIGNGLVMHEPWSDFGLE
ncbi:hypothetical protein VMCG_01913 [Cytospora schulzeri]|uniref:F-box domain-containing protein n=1 Tax=Cytospora schulzeri TaxID=448051 RepID=A0A423X3X8_9PEZI|nr:hypothetical protein VMCG_01913 [Valsa malicola]